AGRGPACPVVWEAGGEIPPPTRLGGLVHLCNQSLCCAILRANLHHQALLRSGPANGYRFLRCSAAHCDTWPLVSAPLVVVIRWRIILPGFCVTGHDSCRIPVHFGETDMAIDETDQVLRIVIVTGCSPRLMPRPGRKGGDFHNQKGFGRLL